MTYRPDPSITAPTQIFVSPLTSPHGYDVGVTGGRATKNGSYVQVRATSPDPVKVTVTPRS
jgi:endoglycosylceramidase